MKDRPWHFASTKGGWLGTNIFFAQSPLQNKQDRTRNTSQNTIQDEAKEFFWSFSFDLPKNARVFVQIPSCPDQKSGLLPKFPSFHPMRAEGSWWKFGVAKNGFTNLKFGLGSWKEPGKHQRLGGPRRSQVFGPPFLTPKTVVIFSLRPKRYRASAQWVFGFHQIERWMNCSWPGPKHQSFMRMLALPKPNSISKWKWNHPYYKYHHFFVQVCAHVSIYRYIIYILCICTFFLSTKSPPHFNTVNLRLQIIADDMNPEDWKQGPCPPEIGRIATKLSKHHPLSNGFLAVSDGESAFGQISLWVMIVLHHNNNNTIMYTYKPIFFRVG